LQFTEVNVNEGTGTVLLRAIFPNPQRLLLPGMYVHAAVIEGVNRNGIVVPQQAISRNTHGDATVLVVGEDDKAQLRVIETGPAIEDKWVVTSGLRPGEQVIVDGLQNTRSGAAVRPLPTDAVAATKKS
jgi:membrane fusion protein, multidrug efflux system